MKRSKLLYLLGTLLVLAMLSISCTKEGPAGPAGSNGKDGVDGVNGTDGADGADGVDGTTTCTECHSDNQVIWAKENQWAVSMHANGHAFARNGGECAVCHTSQGFLGNLDGSYDWQADGAMISDPNPQNCYTCHMIHDTYTVEDLALTVTGAVELRNTNGGTHDFGAGSVCASCHQGRTVDPFPVEGGDDITVTSSRYGVHHGPQGNAVAGMGLFEPGSGYSNHIHSTGIADACVTCHMAEAYGTDFGGHTFNVAFDGDLNTAGCLTCHGDEDALIENTEELQAEIAALLLELKGLLDAAGITADGSDSSIQGTYSAEVAGACLNYKALTEDGSLGVHNPTYIKKVLQNSIAALQ